MKIIIPPITVNSSPDIIANLQAALVALGFPIEPNELNDKKAGPSTTKALHDFQAQNQLHFTDVFMVDDATATLLNRIMKDKGLLTDEVSYKVSGTVKNAYGEPLVGIQLIGYDVDLAGAKIYLSAHNLQEIQANKGMQFLGKATFQAAI